MARKKRKPAKKRRSSPAPGIGGPNIPGGMGGMGGMMAQVQKLQEEMGVAQEGLKDEMVEASVGGGMVTVRMTAMQELKAIEIQPEVVDPDDVEMLQDLLMAAFNQAAVKAQALSEERMAPFTDMLDMSSLGLGGLF